MKSVDKYLKPGKSKLSLEKKTLSLTTMTKNHLLTHMINALHTQSITLNCLLLFTLTKLLPRMNIIKQAMWLA